MARQAADPIAQMIAQRKDERAERTEQRQATTAERQYGLDVAKFGYQQAHDSATYALDKQRTNAEAASKYLSMAKEMYDLRVSTARAADVGHFYNFLSKINPDDPDAANKIGALKASFPQAMQDEGVRATLSNDWSQVLSQRGLSRSDREANDKRTFLMNYAAANAKDDEFSKNNPELKAIHDMYAKDLSQYEAKKRVAQGVATEQPATQPIQLNASSFFAPQAKPAAATPTATPAEAPVTQPAAAPTAAPVATPPDQRPPFSLPTLGANSGVPPASTPKETQVADWANANPNMAVAQEGGALDVNLPENPTAGDVYKVLGGQPTPPPTPPPQPAPREDEAVA